MEERAGSSVAVMDGAGADCAVDSVAAASPEHPCGLEAIEHPMFVAIEVSWIMEFV